MDAQFAALILFIVLLTAGLLGLLAALFMERGRLKRWVDKASRAKDDRD